MYTCLDSIDLNTTCRGVFLTLILSTVEHLVLILLEFLESLVEFFQTLLEFLFKIARVLVKSPNLMEILEENY